MHQKIVRTQVWHRIMHYLLNLVWCHSSAVGMSVTGVVCQADINQRTSDTINIVIITSQTTTASLKQ